MDNATNNYDTALEYIVVFVRIWVGLKEHNDVITKVRNVVRFDKGFGARM